VKKCSRVKTGIKGGIIGVIIHSILCPVHGLIPIILIKIGLAEVIGLGFLYKFHDSIAENVIEPVISLIIKNNVEEIAHTTLDILGILIALGIAFYFISRELKNTNKKHNHSHH